MSMALPPTVEWLPNEPAVRIIDQTLLPARLEQVLLCSVAEVAEAIKILRVRGAPAIGCAAAAGIALAAATSCASNADALRHDLSAAHDLLAGTRPTAVNLFWALGRMREIWSAWGEDHQGLVAALSSEARAVIEDDLDRCRRIGHHGATLIPDDAKVMTHCNAGALATAGYGTALGVIRAAVEQGKRVHVWVDETRPLLQGARLTAFELAYDGIPCTVICDNMAASLMAARRVDCVVVGADRITADGDVANKIGTYGLAVLARHHGVPFYVAAPYSTVDFALAEGSMIPIEHRGPDEVRLLGGFATQPILPDSVEVHNPAFDVTPAELVTAIVTELGVARPPLRESLSALASATPPQTPTTR
jgi:methylthioribose-1-phosphate isomerase